MSEVTRILAAVERGDSHAAEQLLPLIYDELRKLAAQKMAQEAPGQTLQATGLVHEAYLRLVDVEKVQRWDSRGHFFAAAAEAMRRILVDGVRRRRSQKRGGDGERIEMPDLPDAVCTDRIAAGTFAELVARTVGTSRQITLTLDRPPPKPLDGLATVPDNKTVRIQAADVAAELPPLLERVRAAGCQVEDIDVQSPTLQLVFLHLTGRDLRE